MPSPGYVRFPTIHQDRIVFVSEDDLWLISSEGGRAERLTAGEGEFSLPRFSPDGQQLAFVGREEGPREVYVMPSLGDPAQRLTFQASYCRVLGWSPDGENILYSSNAGQFIFDYQVIHAISPKGGLPRQLPFGMVNAIAYGPQGEVVLGRNMGEPSFWKRYRGGTVGHLWFDPDGSGAFQRLLKLEGNMTSPCWVGDRVYFLSDHEGLCNIYSCTASGSDVQRHTRASDHRDFYARNLSGDGKRLVYHAGGELYLFNPESDTTRRIDVELPSLRTQRNRKFVQAWPYLDWFALHPQGYAAAITTRGKVFSMGNWEGPVLQHGERDGVRYRMLEWLNDGKRLVAISDEIGREALVIFDPEEGKEPKTLKDVEFGRAINFQVSPADDVVAITNHRNELIAVNLESGESRVLDRSVFGRIHGMDWSPDGLWLAYGFAYTAQKTAIKLCNVESGETYFVTDPVLSDVSPSFDPEGKYLYFLGYRTFDPVEDSLQFDYGFPRGVRPYAILLNKDLRSPFVPESRVHVNGEREKEEVPPPPTTPIEVPEAETVTEPVVAEQEETPQQQEPSANKRWQIEIDLKGITNRILPFPVPENRYRAVRGIKGKAIFLSFPIDGESHADVEANGNVHAYDFETHKYEWLTDGVGGLDISRDGRYAIYRTAYRLRVLKAGEKAPKQENNDRPNRDTGWLDLHRIKVSVQPAAEWKQMFAEAWRLQREHFWAEDMSGVDWDAIYTQYAPLVERVGSRSELSDLFWEIQGELGTSHAYEHGGEYRSRPYYRQGFLGVDWNYDAEDDRYRIAQIIRGNSWEASETSPLAAPGLKVVEGDAIIAINGQRVSSTMGPEELLVSQAGQEVHLTMERDTDKGIYVIVVKALSDEGPARYRRWVENTRSFVHMRSEGRVGYIHVPDMKAEGFAEFHRGYLAEYDYPGLIIDVRWNGGGRVSSLLLEKLSRRRIGYKFPRWGQPTPYPREAPRGPMVALTNEHAASDGDIFSHAFQLMGLGPLIGMRTWGGVIGIAPSHRLVDETKTTQPEYANWFKDVGWDLENRGAEPDIEVEVAPQDYVDGADLQLERAITEVLRLIEENPSLEPRPGDRPQRGR